MNNDHRHIAHALASAATAANLMSTYSPAVAGKIETACRKVESNEPRSMTTFRRMAEKLQDYAEVEIEESELPTADSDYQTFVLLSESIDKSLGRIQNSSAASSYDASEDYGIYCPACRQLLRSAASEQCFECGADWHS